MEKNEYGYINALKGIAIMGVTMVHVGGQYLPGCFGKIGYDGARGVQIFFLISAMLAFKSLSRSFPDRKMSAKGILQWYAKKLIRILPLYYLAILVSMLTQSWNTYWLGTEGHVTVKNLIAHILMLHGFIPHYTDSVLGVDWYLGCLWIFLLLSPFLYRIIDSFEKSVIFAVIVYLVNPVLNLILAGMLPMDSDPGIYQAYIEFFGPFSEFLIYVTGIVLFFVTGRIQRKELQNKKLLSYSILILAVTLLWGQINGAASLWRLSRIEMFGLFFAMIIVSQSICPSVLIDNPFFRLFGKYSYGIYLFQFIWIYFYERYINYTGPLDWTIKYVSSLAALLAISVLVTAFIEKPLQEKLKIFITDHNEGRDTHTRSQKSDD